MRSVFIVLIVIIIAITGCKKEESNPVTSETEHFEAEGLYLLSSTYDTLVYYFQGVIRSGDTLRAVVGQLTDHMKVKFLDADQKTINPPDDPEHKLGWAIADTSLASVYQHDETWEFHLRGKKAGMTTIELQIVHEGHADFRTRPFPVIVK